MAAVEFTITLECDLIQDAVSAVILVHQRLLSRHGEQFRDLQRRIETVCSEPEWAAGEAIPLGHGHFVAQPPGKLVDILAKARALGVI